MLNTRRTELLEDILELNKDCFRKEKWFHIYINEYEFHIRFSLYSGRNMKYF